MFVKKLDELPENLRAQFVESEFNGEKGFQHKETVALLNSMKNAKAERDEIKGKYGDLETRLNAFEETKKTEIEAARAEALEKARTNGDVAVIEQRYQQQLDDLKERSSQETETWKNKYAELKTNNIKATKNSLVSDLAVDMANEKANKAFKVLLSSRVDIDPETGKVIYLDENGGATSLDAEGFKAEIKKDDMFAPLLKSGIVTNGGGNANGGGGGANTTKKFNEYSGAELKDIRSRDPQLYDRLKNEYKNT